MKDKITAETTLADALSLPGAAEVLAEHRLPCLSCPMAAQEMDRLSLGEIAARYGLPLEQILEDLNRGL